MSHQVSKELAQKLREQGVNGYFIGGVVKAVMNPVSQVIGGITGGLAAKNNYTASPVGVDQQKFNDVYGQQQQLAQALLAQSQGQGPNPALAQLNMATGQNVATQAALMASQRGAAVNPALVARLAAQQGAGIQQDAIGQAAAMQAQQQLAAQQNLQQQYAGMQNANLGLSGQQAQTGMQAQQINAGVAAANQQGQNQITGALINAGGGVAAKAVGAAHGGLIPGEPEVHGDSEANDTVPALLSPGEIVIPRSIVNGPNAHKNAAHFVKMVLDGEKTSFKDVVKSRQKMAKGGMVGAPKKLEEPADESQAYRDAFMKDVKSTSLGRTIADAASGFGQSLSILSEGSAFSSPDTRQAMAQPTLQAPEVMAPEVSPQIEQQPMQQPMQAPLVTAPQPGIGGGVSVPGALNQFSRGVKAEGQALAAQGQEIAGAYDESLAMQEKLMADSQAKQDEIVKKNMALAEEIASGKVDPDRYWSSKSTGRKVGISLGILLSGIGAGLQGGNAQNLALQIIDKDIDRDIDAQKTELGKKQNLLSENYRMLGDMRAATEATRMQMTSVLQGKIAKITAKTNDPIIKARGEQMIAQLQLQTAPLAQKVGASQAEATIMKEAQKDPSKLPQYIDAIAVSNPERAKELRGRLVPGAGLANTAEGAKGLSEMQTMVDSASKEIDKLLKITKQSGKSLSLNTRAEADTIRTGLVGALRVPVTGPGAMSDGEREMLLKMVPNVAAFSSLDSNSITRLETLKKSLAQKYQSMGKANGVNINLDSIAPDYKIVNGVKYRRGPKGEAIRVNE